MAVLNHGVLEQIGTPTQLYDTPINPFVAGFVGSMNLLAATVRTSGMDGALLDIEGFGPLHVPHAASISAGNAVGLSTRPHSLRMLPPDAATHTADNLAWASGQVEASEFQGGCTRYRIMVARQHLLVDLPHRIGTQTFPFGALVRVGIDPSQVRVFSADAAAAV